MDLGSAVLSAEMALELLPEERRAGVMLCEAPLVEGAVAAAVTAKLGSPLEAVAREARGGLAGKLAHLGVEEASAAEPAAGRSAEPADAIRITVRNEHGLHARPAARLVQVASSFDAHVEVRNLTASRGPADAHSLNAVATLGVRTGHEIEVSASGPQARAALDAVAALAARNFDEAPGAPAATVPEPAPGSANGRLRGFAVSPGVAVGPARRLHPATVTVPDREAGPVAGELAALERAVEAARADIAAQRTTVAARAGEDEAAIFDAHLLFLQDADILEPARAAVHGGGTAEGAWAGTIERLARTWDDLDDDYLRARAADLRSVGDQVLAHLVGAPLGPPRTEGPGVLVAADLSPAETAGLDPEIVTGIATAAGGPTSHTAVLARSLGIPAVVGAGPASARRRRGHADRRRRRHRRRRRGSRAGAVVGAARHASGGGGRTSRPRGGRRPARPSPSTACRGGRRQHRPAGRDRGGARERRRRRRPVPHRVPVHGPRPDARRGRADRRLRGGRRGPGRPTAAAAHARRRRRQAGAVPRAAPRGQPVPRRARHPPGSRDAGGPRHPAARDPARGRAPSDPPDVPHGRVGATSCARRGRPWTGRGRTSRRPVTRRRARTSRSAS